MNAGFQLAYASPLVNFGTTIDPLAEVDEPLMTLLLLLILLYTAAAAAAAACF